MPYFLDYPIPFDLTLLNRYAYVLDGWYLMHFNYPS